MILLKRFQELQRRDRFRFPMLFGDMFKNLSDNIWVRADSNTRANCYCVQGPAQGAYGFVDQKSWVLTTS